MDLAKLRKNVDEVERRLEKRQSAHPSRWTSEMWEASVRDERTLILALRACADKLAEMQEEAGLLRQENITLKAKVMVLRNS